MMLQLAKFHSFLWVTFQCVCECVSVGGAGDIFFIHFSVDGHLGCFHVSAIVNNAAGNIEVHISI